MQIDLWLPHNALAHNQTQNIFEWISVCFSLLLQYFFVYRSFDIYTKNTGKRPKHTYHQRSHTAGKWAYKKMLHIICHQVLEIKTKRCYTLIRMAKIWNTEITKCWWGYRTTGILIYCSWECKSVHPVW